MANHWDRNTRSEYRKEVAKLSGQYDDVEQNTLEGELEAAKTRNGDN